MLFPKGGTSAPATRRGIVRQYGRGVPRHENPLDDPVDSDGRLSAQLCQSRTAASFGLAEAGEAVGWSPNHLSQVKNGKQTPSELITCGPSMSRA